MSSKKDQIAKLEAERDSLRQQLQQLESAIPGEKAAEQLHAALDKKVDPLADHGSNDWVGGSGGGGGCCIVM